MNFHSSLHAHHLGAVLGTGKRKKSWTRAVFSHLQRKGLEKRFQVKRLKTYLIFLSICGLCKHFFFNVGPLKDDIFFDHHLWSVFQSSLYTCYKLQFFTCCTSVGRFMYCIYTCLSDLWVLPMFVHVLFIWTCLATYHVSIPMSNYTMSCPIKANSNTIELKAQTSCYCFLDLLCVNREKKKKD